MDQTLEERREIEDALDDRLDDDNEADCDYRVIYHWNHLHVECD